MLEASRQARISLPVPWHLTRRDAQTLVHWEITGERNLPGIAVFNTCLPPDCPLLYPSRLRGRG